MKLRTLTTSGVTAAIVVAGTLAATATPATASPVLGFDEARADIAGDVDPDIMSAMKRDFGLTTQGVYDRLAVDEVATSIESVAGIQFFGDYAGTWVNADGTGTIVAVTDPARASEVEELGATPKIVAHDLQTLQATQERLDAVTSVPDGIHSWYVDVTQNAVVVTAENRRAVAALTDAAGLRTRDVHYEHSAEQARPLYNIRGGDAYYMGGRCSVGFSVTHSGGSGFVTAGHCGTVGTAVQGYNQVAMGTFRGSVFPGSDYAWVATNTNWTSTPKVNGYGQADFTVTDGVEKPSGAAVCRSGSTTGVHCGTIGPKNQTVTYPQGTVRGMTRTNVCAEPGDSGGSWISNGSAQGVTSGGSGDCNSGGTTYFFPLTTIMAAYPGLTLTTDGGGGPGPGPGGCDDAGENYSGSLSGTGDYDFQPNGDYYYSGAGTHIGCLAGPSGTDYDLELQRWNGSSWSVVARSETPTSEESISYNGSAGYYVWRIYSYSGSGAYAFGMDRP
ncbi:streptogrisin C [Stackebrandtia albiflava]|uniref:Streptogrisin C n=1 Tax=Stackebrandtia albiflava TaxID=406432 RepID=A0A562URL1_9ACTN|nr:S1 family peptidase [Stackebrandtia albiflava]TWJ08253.1 streptogrisin C [Stackebrandtia albiflava]